MAASSNMAPELSFQTTVNHEDKNTEIHIHKLHGVALVVDSAETASRRIQCGIV